MSSVKLTLTLDEGEIRKLVTGEGRPVHRLMVRLQRNVANSAKQRSPVDTGNLRNSITIQPLRVVGSAISGGVSADANYAMFVHDGTKPHVIRPKKAGGVLRFTVGGSVVFARSVNHPGTKARPFLMNALESEAPKLGFRVES